MESYQERALAYLKGEMCDDAKAAFEEELTRSEELRMAVETSRELLDVLEAAGDEAVINQVNGLIQEAIRSRASDIHIVGQREDVVVWLRVDGRLQECTRLPKEVHQRIVDRWKVMAEMNVSEGKAPQIGRFPVRYQGRNYDLRVNVSPTALGERVNARVMDRDNVLLGLDKLGLSDAQQASIQRIVDNPRGYILVGGFEGNGKTTMLYSMLMAVNGPGKPFRNVFTIEDPVEYLLPGLSQTSVNRKAGLTFSAGLRNIFYSDPDVVYISQLRDLESAELGIELALTGQLVFSQLHVSSAVLVIQRLREMGLVNFLIGYTLRGSVGVRLVRRVCSDCTEEYMPSATDLRKAGLSPVEDGPFRRGRGCPTCRDTGFLGRIGLFEVLEVNDAIRKAIAEEAPLQDIWYEAFGRNGGSLWDDAREKVRQGLTTVEEVAWALTDYPHPHNSVDTVLRSRNALEID